MIQPSILTAKALSPQITRVQSGQRDTINHIGFTFKGEKTKNKKIKKEDWCFLQLLLGGQSHLKSLLNKMSVQLQANRSVLWHPKGTLGVVRLPNISRREGGFAHHSIAPARQGKEGEGAVFSGDRMAQVLQTLVLGLEPGHRGEVAAQDILSGEKRQNDFLFHFHILMIIR